MTLRHRDRELLRFEWLEPQGGRVVSVVEGNRRSLPLEMKGRTDDEALWSRLKHRVVPRNHRNVEVLLAALGLKDKDIKGIIGICRGLSLNDGHDISARRMAKIEDFLRERVDKIIEFGEKADEYLKINRGDVTVSPQNTAITGAGGIEANMKADPFVTVDELAELLGVNRRTVCAPPPNCAPKGASRAWGRVRRGIGWSIR